MPETLFRVTLETRDGRRALTAPTEREAALMGESVMRLYEGQPLTVGFSVECADREARSRVAFYLTDLALELELACDRYGCAAAGLAQALSLEPWQRARHFDAPHRSRRETGRPKATARTEVSA
ncbi:hypothetical protein [Methylorubrum extorquens]